MHRTTRVLTSALAATALMSGGALVSAAPAQAATCTTTPTTWADLSTAFATAPATGAVICLGADITHPAAGTPTDGLAAPYGSNITFDLNGHSLDFSVLNIPGTLPYIAGIDASNGTTLTIDATGGGSLTVSNNTGGAAIGGAGDYQAFGNVIINGGTITASTGYDGAAIGSGQYSAATGSVTINGGTITADTTNCGAAIGSGEYSDGTPPVTINGGTITATATCGAAAIGGASDLPAGPITINGGTVNASASQGAAIGGGGNGGPVVITGGDITAATRLYPGGGAAIGTGFNGGSPGTLTLVGAGTPTPTSGNNSVALSPTATVQAGPPDVVFFQTTTDGSGSTGPSTRIVFARTPTITTDAVPAATVGQAYSAPITATGTGPVTFALATGSVLPAGLTLDPATGVIAGTPTTPGTYTFSISATNAYGSDTQAYTLVVPAAAAPTSAPSSPAAVAGSTPTHLASTGLNGTAMAVVIGVPAAVMVAFGAFLTYRRRIQH